MPREQTSSRIAKIAAKGISRPQSLTPAEIAAVCGSALTQLELARAKPPKKAKQGGK